MENSNFEELFLIYDFMMKIGITMNYKGFIQTAYAVYYSMRDLKRLETVTKKLYPLVARRCNTTVAAVEKNIRTIVDTVWWNHRNEFENVMHIKLNNKPGNAQFIAILTMRMLKLLKYKVDRNIYLY